MFLENVCTFYLKRLLKNICLPSHFNFSPLQNIKKMRGSIPASTHLNQKITPIENAIHINLESNLQQNMLVCPKGKYLEGTTQAL